VLNKVANQYSKLVDLNSMINKNVFQDDDEVIENEVIGAKPNDHHGTGGLQNQNRSSKEVSSSLNGFEKNGVLLKAMEKVRKENGVMPQNETKQKNRESITR
jgi:hypothetical protein